MTDHHETESLPQGDAALLAHPRAAELMASPRLAYLAFVGTDDAPRVMQTWFHWTGEELVMPTFVAAPHVVRPALRLAALRRRPRVAVTIDDGQDPPLVVHLRGSVTITEHPGVVAEFAAAARRYMPADVASDYLAGLDDPTTVMARIALRPEWVGLLDFERRLPVPLGGIRPVT